MIRNMGSLDRSVRVVLGLLLLAFAFFFSSGGTLAVLAGIVGAVFVVTSAVSFCPLYRVIGLKTCQDC